MPLRIPAIAMGFHATDLINIPPSDQSTAAETRNINAFVRSFTSSHHTYKNDTFLCSIDINDLIDFIIK